MSIRVHLWLLTSFVETFESMLPYRKLTLVLAVSLWMVWPRAATGVDPNSEPVRGRRVEAQSRENRDWKYEAKKLEASLVNTANEHYKNKEFAKAEEYYRKALDVRCCQWELREVTVEGTTSFLPATVRAKHKLRTSYTRIAEDRLRTMAEARKREQTAEAKKPFDKLFEAAEIERQLGNLATACKTYDKIIEKADHLGKEDVAIDVSLKAKKAQEDVRNTAAKLLIEAEDLLTQSSAIDAVKKLEMFKSNCASLLKIAPELKARFDRLTASPEIRQASRELAAMKTLALGDAARGQHDYPEALRRYKSVLSAYADTTSARAASERIADMEGDTDIAEALKQQRVESVCKPLLLEARSKMEAGDPAAAEAACMKIIADYPKSAWAAQASELLKQIKGTDSP